jgi:GNAT superfamily N-acetyltransferase
MPIVDPKVIVTDLPAMESMLDLAKKVPDGVHELGREWVIKKVDGKVVGVIRLTEYKSSPDEDPPTDSLTRIDAIYVSEKYRNQGVAKELLLWLIQHHDAVESNLTVTPAGQKLWKSIEGTPGIQVKYRDGDKDYGHVAWKKSKTAALADTLFDAFQRLLNGDPAPPPEKSANFTPEEIRNFSAADRARWCGSMPGRPSLSPSMVSSKLVRALTKLVAQNPGHVSFYPYGVPKGAEGPAPEMALPEIPCLVPETDDEESEEDPG